MKKDRLYYITAVLTGMVIAAVIIDAALYFYAFGFVNPFSLF